MLTSELSRASKITIAIGAILFFSIAQFNIFSTASELWFDPAFSIETAHKINAGENIDWGKYDVHFPTYYYSLATWMKLNPGLTEFEWARELSAVFGLVFIIAAGYFLFSIFGFKNAVASFVFLSVGSTTIHYFAVEPRSYMVLFAAMALSLCLVYLYVRAAANSLKKGVYFAALVLVMISFPMWHYFGVIAWPFVFLIWFVLEKEQSNMKLKAFVWKIVPVIFCLIIFIVPVLHTAIEQRTRSEGSWFAAPDASSFPSALFYSAFLVDGMVVDNAAVLSFIYYGFILFAGYAAYLMYVRLRDYPGFRTNVLAAMFLSCAVPLLVLLLLSLCSGGFCNLYHHRFFVVITWMFPAACLILLTMSRFDYREWGLIVLGVILISAAGQYAYSSGVHKELQNTIYATPCETALIGHESPFSMLPYVVTQRELGCDWTHFVSTMIGPRRARTSGFDALSEEQIYWNLTLPDEGFYYVRSTSGMLEWSEEYKNRTTEVVFEDDGISLVRVGQAP